MQKLKAEKKHTKSDLLDIVLGEKILWALPILKNLNFGY